jgi:NADH dehydrogenase
MFPDRHLPALGRRVRAIESANAAPGVTSVAKQQGLYVARVIRARLKGVSSSPLFHYRHYGNLATVGWKIAAADFGLL